MTMKYTIKNDISQSELGTTISRSELGATVYEEKIKKSLFIGSLKHVTDMESARVFVTEISKIYPQANHYCPACILGKNGETCFCTDDREPSGTAGKPILNMLVKHELTNVVLVVTRYFGGIELGIRGLIEAYRGVAEKTILKGKKEPVIDYFDFSCLMSYDFYNIFTHKIQIPEIEIIDTKFMDKIEVILRVSEFGKDNLLRVLREMENSQKVLYKGI